MARSLAIGFVGCGRAAVDLHLPAVQALPELRAVAVCDAEAESLDGARKRFGIEATYGDFRDLVNDPAVEAVAVCTPAATHAEIAAYALGAGKPTFVEKPLALTPEDCDRMIAAEDADGAVAVAGHNLRSHALVERARAAIAAGAVGQVQMIRTVWTAGFNLGREMPAWRGNRELGGGALWELGVHHIDLWRYLTGREVADSHAFRFSAQTDDQAVALHGTLDDGTVCSSALCQRTADSNEVEIYGDRGRIRFSVYQADSFVHFSTADYGGGMRSRIKEFKQRAVQFPSLVRSSRRGGAYIESYSRQWRRFVRAARGVEPPACSLRDARAAVEVLAHLNALMLEEQRSA